LSCNINALIKKYPYGTGIALKDGKRWDLTVAFHSPESIMKLAIMLYGTRVSPRFGYSQTVMIVEVSGQEEIRRKTLDADDYYPEQIPLVLGKEGVEVVISGGVNKHFQDLFRSQGIQVMWGIIGEADDALAAFKAGQLAPGMGCCPEGRRPRQRQRRFRGRG
jgi:predicted Fe-Mo cluster-binding NifX family protein